ncbi:inositol monophosphatase [Thermocrinis albus DSM 14484]|uniref:Inositol-1-monophosphatase n=2 Tax=Thermocrinis TaxID=75905 RepID=D3SLR4_THEAH|nr:inositol monophosphatase [Thermocrinis albus DSM 14484]
MDLHIFLRVAKEAALLGGAVLREYFGKLQEQDLSFKGEKDLVSLADKEAEERIRDHILRYFPHHGAVGEEKGGDRNTDFVWFIDPLDGTKNFVTGFPIFGVSVALTFREEPVVGAVYLPYTNNLYWAAKGLGAYKDGREIHVSYRKELKKCAVAYGFPSRARRNLDFYWKILKEIFDKVGSMRRPGAAAVDLCFLAEGIFDGLVEFELNPWDVAAGLLIVKEAGGMVELSKGLREGTDVVAGTPYLFPFLRDVCSHIMEGLV